MYLVVITTIGFKATKQIQIVQVTSKTTHNLEITNVAGVKITDWKALLQDYVGSVRCNKL